MVTPAQGELWLMESPGTKPRPALLVSRDEVIPVVTSVVVAPVTSTVREIPTCIRLGPEQGIDHESVASFDNLRTVPKSVLTRRLGSIGPNAGHLICSALAALADC
jgi:mRNA interferase MazF